MSTPAELDVQKVATILAAKGHDLHDEQIMAITEFIQQVGSVEKAQQAVEALIRLKQAA